MTQGNLKSPMIGLIDLSKREEVVDKILDILLDGDLSLVEQYGILEHCKFCLYTQAINEVEGE
jgi:hypothetical protein